MAGAGLLFALVWFAVAIGFNELEDPIAGWAGRYPEDSVRAGVLSLLSDAIGFIGIAAASIAAVAVVLLT